ncbi:MAG: hypothetical protein KF752_07600 [Pirellulaceae bacterium]|nr:hypothetical protein [Pirellulaceae bacterium]
MRRLFAFSVFVIATLVLMASAYPIKLFTEQIAASWPSAMFYAAASAVMVLGGLTLFALALRMDGPQDASANREKATGEPEAAETALCVHREKPSLSQFADLDVNSLSFPGLLLVLFSAVFGLTVSFFGLSILLAILPGIGWLANQLGGMFGFVGLIVFVFASAIPAYLAYLLGAKVLTKLNIRSFRS